jgi:hypothetical protein
MAYLNRCCTCKDGGTVDAWLNQTKVRTPGAGSNTALTTAPFGRLDSAQYFTDNGVTAEASGLPAGTFGTWLKDGDEHGLSMQTVYDTLEDIIACAADDATHKATDHNCYVKSGTVNMGELRRRGMKGVGAVKQWHGLTGWLTKDGYAPDPTEAPNQVRYLTRTAVVANYYTNGLVPPTTADAVTTGTLTRSASINRLSGIQTVSGVESATNSNHGSPIADATALALMQTDCATNPFNTTDIPTVATFLALWPGAFTVTTSGTTGTYSDNFANADGSFGQQFTLTTTRTDTVYTWDYVWLQSYGGVTYLKQSYSGSITLSDPYTSADCLADWQAAQSAWDLSDGTLGKWRRDELLGNMPWIFYDEVGSAEPGFPALTMDDYTQPQNGDGSWPQRAWLDAADYEWQNPSGGFNSVPNVAGGNLLKTPLRTGDIIAHSKAGSQRHFWFAYQHMVRKASAPGAAHPYYWAHEENGRASESPLPEVTLRWLNKLEAQYDPNGGKESPGVFPGAYLHQASGVLTGVKFVEVAQPWLATNYGRPCGPDKYAVQQDTVCCIASKAGSVFTVKKTGDAIAPLATGGLDEYDYIIAENDGIYRIEHAGVSAIGVDANGNPQWEITVGSKLDDLPTGYAMGEDPDGANHLGRLRWPSASGICGRVAVIAVEASGTVTLTVAAQKYLRKDPATGTILVDLYLANMTGLVQPTLTRVSDTSFTFSTTGLTVPTGGWSALVWMTGRGVDYTKFSDAPRRTGIKLEWSFNPRQYAKESAGGYSGTYTGWCAGVGGCTECDITEFSYDLGRCRPVVGFVPFYSPLVGTGSELLGTGSELLPATASLENFGSNQKLYPMPATFAFDDVYSSHWQGGIEMTMPDPFWQTPFKPDCDTNATTLVTWTQDDGSGTVDFDTTSGGGAITTHHRFYAFHPVVEAAANIPAGCTLPSGVNLLYDLTTQIAPPRYPNGVNIGDAAGNFESLWRPWGLSERACPAIQAIPRVGRWADYYAGFIPC